MATKTRRISSDPTVAGCKVGTTAGESVAGNASCSHPCVVLRQLAANSPPDDGLSAGSSLASQIKATNNKRNQPIRRIPDCSKVRDELTSRTNPDATAGPIGTRPANWDRNIRFHSMLWQAKSSRPARQRGVSSTGGPLLALCLRNEGKGREFRVQEKTEV